MRAVLSVVASTAAIVGMGCGGASPTSPGGGDTITGSERLGWTQPTDNTASALSYSYAVYVDDVLVPLRDAACQAAGSSGLACASPLPPLNAGRHVLEVVAIDGSVIGGRSQPLTVTVVAR